MKIKTSLIKRESKLTTKYKSFKKFPGYRIYYDGRVSSVKGNGQGRGKEKFLSIKPSSDGYCRVCLRGKDGKAYTKKVNVLVARAWVKNPNKLPVSAHKDDIKSNNHYLNLEWQSYSDNNKQAWLVRKQNGNDIPINKKEKESYLLNLLTADNLQQGWEKINEFLFLECHKIEAKQGAYYGTEWISFNNFIRIRNAWVNPNFDFGKKLGYSKAKWSALVKNYVNIHYVEIVKNTINHREGKNAKSYNHTIHFTNKHGSGKDCLISLTLTKRPNIKRPIAVFHIRTSEVTKRLLFDFLLVQRVIEFIYGHNDVEVHFFAPSFYITAESFVMYNNIKPLKKLLNNFLKEKKKKIHYFQKKVLDTIQKYLDHPNPHDVMFRVTRRSMLQIRKDENGEPESGVGSMFAKDLKLVEPKELFPKDVITKKQIKKFKGL